MAESLHVDLTASAGGFIGAVEQSTAALKTLQKQADSMGAIGSFLSKTVLPAATAIAGAFATSKALSLFGDSDLPGAKAYTEALDNSKRALKHLGEAVGEYLAPAAIRVAEWVKDIADRLTPLVRQFTAFSESAGKFLLALGSNVLEAVLFAMPALTEFINDIKSMFDGPAIDWQARITAFVAWWNSTWTEILDYVAPIIAALTQLVDVTFWTALDMARSGVDALRESLSGLFSDEAASGVSSLADDIQSLLIVAISAAEYAVLNWRDAFKVSYDFIASGISALADNFKVMWDNATEVVRYFGNETKVVFTSLFGPDGYVVALLKETFINYLPQLVKNSIAAVGKMGMNPFGGAVKPELPDFKAPLVDFNFGGRPGPNLTPLPGFANVGSAGWDSFTSGFFDFMGEHLPRINDLGEMLFNAISFNLPDVTAKPNDFIAGNPITRDSESTKQTGLAMEGSKEAYKAILAMQNRSKDEALEVAKAQLNEQKKLNDKVGGMGLAAGAIP